MRDASFKEGKTKGAKANIKRAAFLGSMLLLTSCATYQSSTDNQQAVNVTAEAKAAFINTYGEIAHASFVESLTLAKTLQAAINDFLSDPKPAKLEAAKAAYTMARKPYSQTEVFRFDEGFVGSVRTGAESVDGWEGQVNAWPLDEALIDYVDASYDGEYNESVNVINSNSVEVKGNVVDVSTLTPEVIISLNELGGSEANVATGYHAVEFLLWGQDVNGVSAGAGNRPVSDYYQIAHQGRCTSGSSVNSGHAQCVKRASYLELVTQQLIDDLTVMVNEWAPEVDNTLRADIASRVEGNAIQHVLYGMGSLSLGELASERMQVALVAGSPEDEHDCFSDTTHNSYAYNARAILNIYEGRYVDQSGEIVVSGNGLQTLLSGKTNQLLENRFASVLESFEAIVTSAEEDNVKFDQLIATVGQASVAKEPVDEPTQLARRALVSSAVTDLQQLTDAIEIAAKELGIESLDSDCGTQFCK